MHQIVLFVRWSQYSSAIHNYYNLASVRGQVGSSTGARLKAGRRQRAVSDTSFRRAAALYTYPIEPLSSYAATCKQTLKI